MEKNFIEKHLSTNWPEKIGQRLVALMAFTLLFSFFAHAQDAAVVPANDNTKVPWVNGGAFTGTVTPTSITGPWTSIGNVTDIDVSNVAHVAFTGNGTKTAELSVSNGQTYSTKAFTGYWVGVVASRSINIGAAWALNALNGGTQQIVISTYMNGVVSEVSDPLGWALLGNTDVGFYVHKPFNEVRVKLVSTAYQLIGSPTGQQRLGQVYLQRYTRFGGGADNVGDKEATCNAQIPLTGRAIQADGTAFTIVAGVPVYVPAGIWATLLAEHEDMDPNTHGPLVPYITLGGATYKGSLTDEAVVYPAGTLGGAVYRLTGAFATAVVEKKLTFYLDGDPVFSKTNVEIFNANAVGEYMVVGEVSPVPFNKIEYEINMYLGAGAGAVEIFYPIVQRFCDAPVACTNEPVSLINGVQLTGVQNHPVYAKAIGTSVVNVSIGEPGIVDAHRVVDSDLNNFATIGDAVIGGQVYSNYGISVVSRQKAGAVPVDPNSFGYPGGTFAGFEIEETDWASGAFAKKYIISTYKNGVLVENYSNQDFAGVDFFTPNKGRHIIGFKTTAPFDEVRITVEKIVSASALSPTRVYHAVLQEFCPTVLTDLTDCNERTNLKRSNGFPVYIDTKNTGIVGVASGNTYFEGLDNLTNSSTDPAKLFTTVGAVTTASVAIQDGSKTTADLYPKGTFAGFDVAFPVIAAGQLAGSTITVSLLSPSGAVIHSEVMNSSFFGAHSSILSGTTARQVIGYAAPVPFSGVKLTIQKNASVSWGEIAIYSAVIQRFCAAEIACDQIDRLRNPEHPVYINGKNTGVNALADGNSLIANSQNAIDANATNYAEMHLGVTAAAEIGFSVANGIYNTDGSKYHYPAETYVGFDVETQNWFDVNGLYQTQIELYRDGTRVQFSTGDQLGAGASSSIVSGGWQRQILGTVAHTTFDEVRLVVQRVAGATVGEMRIYDFVARNFDPATATACYVPIECNKTIPLTDNDGTGGSIPAVVEFDRTGYTGAVSGGYGIENAWNVVSPSISDFARIHLPLSGATSGSISVATPGKVYPAGTYAGFTVQKQPFIFAGGAFVGVTVRTYLHGVLREEKTDAALLDFSLLTQLFGTPTNFYNPGFKTTLTFDEIQVSIGSLASAADQTLDVYGAYVDTRESTPVTGDGSTSIACYPDLTPTITLSDATFSAGEVKNFIANITEVRNVVTNDQTSFSITVPPGFRIETFDNTLTSVTPSGGTARAVQNAKWYQVSKTTTKLVLKANTGTVVGPGASNNRANLGLKITRTSAATGATGNITVLIIADTTKGYDSDASNNTVLRILTNQ